MLPSLSYSHDLLAAIDIAQSIARDHRHHVWSGVHLLRALLDDDVNLADKLETWNIDLPYIKEWTDIRIGEFPRSMAFAEEPPIASEAKKMLEVSDIIRLKLSETQITPFSVLAAICRPNIVFTTNELKTLPLTEKDLLSYKVNLSEALTSNGIGSNQSATNSIAKNGQSSISNTKVLSKYCIDKTQLAREEKIDPIIGREGEVRMMAEILCRRTKPNVILVGEPGVGKTALVEGFALKIVNDEVTKSLKTATVLELDVGALVAGASYKGELEDRLKKVIKEVKEMDNVILFVDEIHMLLDAGNSSGGGAANLLKPELARGAITVIGATTNDEYRKYIEKDEAFSRRFEVLRVEEPDGETAIRMLKAILPKYEKHHGIEMDARAVEQAVKLAKRFLRTRSLPDSAVDLMDRTMASIRLMSEASDEVLEALSKELAAISSSDLSQDANLYYQELIWFNQQIHHRISPILINKLKEEEEQKIAIENEGKALAFLLEQKLTTIKALVAEKIEIVTAEHIAAIVSYKTGIPTGKIQAKEREKLLNMEQALGKRVIGQDHTFSIIADAIRNGRAKLKDPGKPVGSFFFLGPTGTGKTELAKSIADFLFDDENAIIRFDMSEYKEGQSESALLGASPGLVGYEEGGPLINKIRQQPYSVVLFDEIEKASNSIFDIFLKILDEGKAKDKLEKEGDFSNAIIIFTSNIAQKAIIEKFKQGEIPDEAYLKQEMKGRFRPEFLARIDGIIPFSFITKEAIPKIFDIHLRKLAKRMEEQGIGLKVSEAAKMQIALDGYSEEFGARPLIGEIRKQLSNPISKMVIQASLKAGQELEVDTNDTKTLQWSISS